MKNHRLFFLIHAPQLHGRHPGPHQRSKFLQVIPVPGVQPLLNHRVPVYKRLQKYRFAPESQGPMARKLSSSCSSRTTVVRNS